MRPHQEHILFKSPNEFSFSEIEEATCNFNPSLKIGEGGYGNVFKGILRHTEVAIKMLNPNSSQGTSEFQQEVSWLDINIFFFISKNKNY